MSNSASRRRSPKELSENILTIGTTSTTAMAGNRTPTATIRGGVLQQTAIADVSAAPTEADFNGLLAALRAAGVLATSVTYQWFDAGNGRKVYRRARERKPARSPFPCPMLVRPFAEPIQSMADGRYYDTPRDLERTYRADGNPQGEEYIPLGNETLKTVAPDRRSRPSAARIFGRPSATWKTGNLPPEIAAIQ